MSQPLTQEEAVKLLNKKELQISIMLETLRHVREKLRCPMSVRERQYLINTLDEVIKDAERN